MAGDEDPHRVDAPSQRELAAVERLRVPARRARLGPAQAHEPEEELLVEPVLFALARERLSQQARLLACELLRHRDEDVRRAEVAVVLRDLVLEDQVVAPGVPRQLAHEAVILVQVVPRVREDRGRARRDALSSSKTSLTSAPTYGK